MTKNELELKLAELKTEYEKERVKAIRQYCEENNPYRVGDTFTDHIGSIRIEKILPYLLADTSDQRFPCMVYEGIELKKDGTPKANNPTRQAWQCNEKK